MKKLKFFAFLCILVSFAACSSDDNGDSTPTNSSSKFVYNGDEYPLKTGAIENDSEEWSDDGSTNYYITLASTELSLDDEGELIPQDDVLSLIELDIYSKDSSKPKTGQYTFNEDHELDYTIEGFFGIINLKYNPDEDSDSEFDEMLMGQSGTVDILQSGSTYEIEFEFTNYNGKLVSGYYKGSLTEYEDLDNDGRPSVQSASKSLKQQVQEIKSHQ